MVENRDYFIKKWEEQIKSEDVLVKVIAKRFVRIFQGVKPKKGFKSELYFKLVEMITVFDGKMVISLLAGSKIECKD